MSTIQSMPFEAAPDYNYLRSLFRPHGDDLNKKTIDRSYILDSDLNEPDDEEARFRDHRKTPQGGCEKDGLPASNQGQDIAALVCRQNGAVPQN